jgi:biotin carboxylase
LKNLLIISGGIEAVPGIKIAKKMGLHVIVSDANPNAPGFEYSDDNIIASTYNIDETLLKVNNYNNSVRKIDGVMCIASDVPLTVASVANELKLPGITIKSAELAMDKMAMKLRFSKDKIPIPNFLQLDNISHLKKTINDWGYPVVIKPVDSRGARGVLLLTEKVDLKWAWDHSRKNSPTGRVMLESFLKGSQISTESIMVDGICYTLGFSDRNYEYLEKYAPFIIENGGDLPSFLSKEIQEKVKKVVGKAALSMGIHNGIVKGDVVVSNGEPYIIELAARLSGGYFCTHEIPFNTGINFVKYAIKIAIGEKINPVELVPKYNKFISQRYFFPKPGIIHSIHGIENLQNNNSIKYFSLHIKPGQYIEKPTAHPSRGGMVIATGESREDAIFNAKKAIEQIKFEYKT